METLQPQMECQHCHRKWNPRVSQPKFCPYCKRPTERVSSKQPPAVEVVEQTNPTGIITCGYPQCNHPAMWKLTVEGEKKSLCMEHAVQEIVDKGQLTMEQALERWTRIDT